MSNLEKEIMLEEGRVEAAEMVVEKVAEETTGFFKKAFNDMKESAKAQHEVDKANFEAVKAESKANFEENKFHNTLAKAKADAKKSWDDAHMSPSERAEKVRAEQAEQIAEAKKRTEEATARYNAAKK